MKPTLSLFLFLFFCLFSYSQISITIIDKITKEAIPFVNISFGNDDGIYTDINGKFDLNLVEGNRLSISSIGYKSVIILKQEIIANTIFLESSNIILEDIVISNKKKAFKLKRTKAINDKDFINTFKNSIGNEMACYIKNVYLSEDVQLKSISIPAFNKTMDLSNPKKQILKRHPFNTLYKISFYTNINGKPGNEIKNEIITVLFNEKTDNLKIDLEPYKLFLPEKGCFIALLNLGPADANKNLIPTSPYSEKEINGKIIRFAKNIKPHFPVNYKKDQPYTYVRYTFNEDKSWKPFYLRKPKNNQIHNISLGYELKIYD